MDKISIENLVPNARKSAGAQSLDIKSLSNTLNSNDIANTFNADVLINTNKVKREKLLQTYTKYYNHCVDQIVTLNNTGKTDLVYDVPSLVPDCKEYNPLNCLEFIALKLQREFIDTFYIDKTLLFITWKYIEFNKFKAEK